MQINQKLSRSYLKVIRPDERQDGSHGRIGDENDTQAHADGQRNGSPRVLGFFAYTQIDRYLNLIQFWRL